MKRKTLGFLALSVSALLVLQTPTTAMAGVWVNGDETVEGNTGEHTGDVSNNYENYDSSKPEYENTIGAVGADANGDSLTVTGNITSTNEPKLTDTATGDTYYPSPVVASNGAEVTVNGNVSSENATAVVADKFIDNAEEGGKVNITGNVSSSFGSAVEASGVGSSVTINGDATANNKDTIIATNNATVNVHGNITQNGSNDSWEKAINVNTNATVNINGDVESHTSGPTIEVQNGNVSVVGDVIGNDNSIYGGGIRSYSSEVTIGGNSSDISANNSTVTVGGNSSDISANNSTVTVGGDLITCVDNPAFHSSSAIIAENSSITVGGNVYSSNNKDAIISTRNSTVTVGGSADMVRVVADNSSVDIGGNIGEISAQNNSSVIVNGNATGNNHIHWGSDDAIYGFPPVVDIDNTSTVLINGNIEITNSSYNDRIDTIEINLNNESNNGSLVVLGDVIAHGPVSRNAIWINNFNRWSSTPITFKSEDLPNIVVGSIKTDEDTGLVGFVKPYGMSDEQEKNLFEDIFHNIMYYINIEQPKGGSINVNSGADNYKVLDEQYLVAHEDGSVSFSVTPDDGYEIDSVFGGEKIDVVKNSDGTYTIKVPRGGGIKISALFKAIEKVIPPSSETPVIKVESSGSSSSKKSDDTTSAPVQTAAKSYSVFNNTIQKDIASVPQNGTLKIDMGNWISFNKKTFELLSKRSDVAITITYKYNGQTYKVTIPAGYPIMDLLDENGYCGCLYLNSIFGSELVTK